MRRHHLLTVVLAAAASAWLAAPALAHEFKGPTGSTEVNAAASGVQTFVFKPFRVTCESAHSLPAESLSTLPGPTLTLQLKFSKCTTHAGKVAKTEGPGIPTHFLSPLTITYNAGGYVEVGAIEIAVAGDFKCKIESEAQTIPAKAVKKPNEPYTAATYKNETIETKSKKMPTQSVVAITNNEVKRIHYTLSEGFCEELEVTEGKQGSIAGALIASVKKTNLMWE